MREPLTISLETELIKNIDRSKGRHVPRSRYIEDIILEFLAKKLDSSTKIIQEESLLE